MKVLSTLYYHVDLEELSVKEFDLRLERDPTSDSYTLFARDSFLDLIKKDSAFIQFMTEMKSARKLPNLVERLSSMSKYSHAEMGLRWWPDVLIPSQPKRYLTTARRVNTGLSRFVRLGNGLITGLKIRCPKRAAGTSCRE